MPDLPTAHYVAASGILNGRWIISGGFAWNYQLQQDTVALDLGDPPAGWTALPWAPLWRWFSAGATVIPTFYTIGSADPGGHAQPDIYAYADGPCGSPTPSPTPTAAPTPPACGVRALAVAGAHPIPIAVPGVAALGGALYSFGGLYDGALGANSFRYDPQTNAWPPIAPLPEAALRRRGQRRPLPLYRQRGRYDRALS